MFLGTHLGTQAWGVQAGAPSVLHPAPGFKGVAVTLPRGETLVFRFLQDFANYIGETVYVDGDVPPTSTITLKERPSRLDATTVARLLEKHSYKLYRERYRGKKVYWVQKQLVVKRKKGGLRPAGSLKRSEDDAERADENVVDRGRDAVGGSLCLYRRQDGDGARYVVLFETSSQKEAEDALSLLHAHRTSRKTE